MEYADLSDLEEGEILEYEPGSPNDSRYDDFEIKECSIDSLKKEYKSSDFQFKKNHDSDMYICEKGRDGYRKKSLKNKWELGKKMRSMKSSISMIDLESISSDEDHRSDEENKYSTRNNRYTCSESRNERKKQSTQFYGTVEDIMSEIGETICRKSHCNYKKRKSKESQHNLKKYSDKFYDLWSHRIFSSHLRNKKHKRSASFSESDSDSVIIEKRKRKKRKRELSYEEDKNFKKNSQVRDFDEMRKTLLEKLKKQKAEEESKANEGTPEMEGSEIQEVDMLIDCTNYVDNTRDAVPEDSAGEGGNENKEDELDLIKLRLIALASNKKQSCEETASSSVKSEEFSETKKSENSNEEVDLDRNELLLRAEALKTALLKKHQKRLNRLKLKKADNPKDKDVNETIGNVDGVLSEEASVSLDADACKENMERKADTKETENLINNLSSEVKIIDMNDAPSESTGSLKKTHPRPRTKRKKRKSGSFASNLKENTDKSEAIEEDDRTLRSQLLSDLMKKKSLKNVEQKSVLLDSIQASANKPPPSVITYQPPKENCKPLPVVRKTVLKKVIPPKAVKPVMGVAIPKAEIQRIIVHLGSEDSSEEDDGTCQASSEIKTEENQDEEKESKEAAAATNCTNVNKAIHADYERSVELLLSQARKKIEGEKRTAKESSLATPEAVYKHLPPSQRLEYIRLKQKIAERERLRKERTNNPNTVPSDRSKTLKTSTKEIQNGVSQESKAKSENTLKTAIKPVPSSTNNGLVIKRSLSKSVVVLHSPSNNKAISRMVSFNGVKTKETNQRRVINKTKNNLEGINGKESNKEPKSAVAIQRNKLLLPSSQALMCELKLLLKKIKMEKIIEENYEKEIVKLKNQLSLLEKKKIEQRFKIKKLGEESMKTYKAIQGITKSNEKTLPKEDSEAQTKKDVDEESKDEKKPEEKKEEAEGKNVSNEPEMELSKAQNETDKRLNNEDNSSEVTKETSTDVCLMKYQSPLDVFNKVSYCSERVDPNVMMCQFDLTGVCKDEECSYQHLRTS